MAEEEEVKRRKEEMITVFLKVSTIYVTDTIDFIYGVNPSASADFFPEEGKIYQGGAKTYYLPKKCPKTYYFLSKKSKNILFWPAKGGQETPLAHPCGRPCVNPIKLKIL
jgi:hypothetical protein